jgi:DNA-binding MarR family transcriptional regulator
MKKDVLEKAALNYLSIPPVIHRTMRHKIVRTTPDNLFEKLITSIHSEIIWLLDEEGPLSVGVISDQLMIAKAQMTQLIEKLVKIGIVERRPVKGDRRKIEIALTDIGNSFIKEHKKNVEQWFVDSLSDLKDNDLRRLVDALAVVKNIVSKLK